MNATLRNGSDGKWPGPGIVSVLSKMEWIEETCPRVSQHIYPQKESLSFVAISHLNLTIYIHLNGGLLYIFSFIDRMTLKESREN